MASQTCSAHTRLPPSLCSCFCAHFRLFVTPDRNDKHITNSVYLDMEPTRSHLKLTPNRMGERTAPRQSLSGSHSKLQAHTVHPEPTGAHFHRIQNRKEPHRHPLPGSTAATPCKKLSSAPPSTIMSTHGPRPMAMVDSKLASSPLSAPLSLAAPSWRFDRTCFRLRGA